MPTCVIKLKPNEIIYDTERFEAAIDPQIHITRDIYDDQSSVVIGKKKSYLLHHGQNYELMGYCHSLSFAMDVCRSVMARKIESGKQYEIHIEKIDESSLKIKLWEYKEGWLYNGIDFHPIEKFKIVGVPKIEMKYVARN